MKQILNIALLCTSLNVYAMEKEEIYEKKDDYKIPLKLDSRINKMEAFIKAINYSLVGAAIGVATERTVNQLFLSSEENSNKDNSWNYIPTLGCGLLGALSVGALGYMHSVSEQGRRIGYKEGIDESLKILNKTIKENKEQKELIESYQKTEKSINEQKSLTFEKEFYNILKNNEPEKENIQLQLLNLYVEDYYNNEKFNKKLDKNLKDYFSNFLSYLSVQIIYLNTNLKDLHSLKKIITLLEENNINLNEENLLYIALNIIERFNILISKDILKERKKFISETVRTNSNIGSFEYKYTINKELMDSLFKYFLIQIEKKYNEISN
jgi:hypothetical protein